MGLPPSRTKPFSHSSIHQILYVTEMGIPKHSP